MDNIKQICIELANLAKREHYFCEDSWYSCPKAEGGCANDAEGDVCTCGADAHNAKINELLAAALARTEPEPIKSFLAKYEDPADARKFLLKAGLIDESGNLALPYRSLSPAADAIYEAYCTEADRLNREVSDREMLAAALKAAADHLTPYSVDQMPGAAFARHKLQVIARELKNYHA